MARVKLNDGSGHWIDKDGDLMTTVWTSEGWLDLPSVYEVEGYVSEEELEKIDPESDNINLDLKIRYEDRTILVNHVDFCYENGYPA